jgi:hypothetical protein
MRLATDIWKNEMPVKISVYQEGKNRQPVAVFPQFIQPPITSS